MNYWIIPFIFGLTLIILPAFFPHLLKKEGTNVTVFKQSMTNKIYYNGHTYYVVHDPDCECKKENNER